jgi:predicted transcriptional regulator
MLCAKDIMTRELSTLQPEATLREAFEMLYTNHLCGAPVVTGTRVVGVISMSDIADVLVNAPEPLTIDGDSLLDERTVGEAMSRDIISVSPDSSVRTIAGIMRNRAVHRILVMENTRLCGIVSAIDIARSVRDKGIAGHTGESLAPRCDSSPPSITL